MTSGDEIISGLVSENEYSYEENEKKARKKGKKTQRDAGLHKRKREENTDEFISDEPEENLNSFNGNTDSLDHTSNSINKNKRRRMRRSHRNDSHEDRGAQS